MNPTTSRKSGVEMNSKRLRGAWRPTTVFRRPRPAGWICLLFLLSAIALPNCASSAARGGPGCIEGNCTNGNGTFIWPGDVRYAGDFFEGLPQGRGAMIYPSGTTCEGRWSAGKLNGVGVCKFVGGDVYDGEWQTGLIHGQGTYHYADGGQYIGEFQNQARSGVGRMTYPDGFVYQGEWSNNLCEGMGELRGPDGRVWAGTFHRGYFVAPPDWEGPAMPSEHYPRQKGE
jgi:hypothetical protein